jgi:predicted ATP-grasp superfamily ATP-dependent carboligase
LRLFVCEYVTGGGFAHAALPPSLWREGDLMLRSLVKDLAELDGVEIVVSRDARLPAEHLPATVVPVGATDDPWLIWRHLIQESDVVWAVAPETDGLLERLIGLVRELGRKPLASHRDALRLCASKSATAAHLMAHAIPVVPTRRLSLAAIEEFGDAAAGWVVKPDDGAGAEGTRLVKSRRALIDLCRQSDATRQVLQPYVAGTAASLSLLCWDGKARLLSCNRQDVLISDGCFHYAGWLVGGLEARRDRYEPIAAAVAAAIPGLWGYVGIDLIDGSNCPLVLEINPRLTTTYAVLRDAIGVNPAQLVLGLGQSETSAALPPVTARPLNIAEHV